LLIEKERLQIVDVQEVIATDTRAPDYFQTQLTILGSPSLAMRVIQDLHLDEHPAFAPETEGESLSAIVQAALADVVGALRKETLTSPEIEDESLYSILKAYLERLEIVPIGRSRVVNVSFASHDPALAAQVANAHAEAYIERLFSMKLSASKGAGQWIQGRLDEALQKLKMSKEALQTFLEREKIVLMPTMSAAGSGAEESPLGRMLSGMNADLAAARTERIGLETLLQQVKDISNTAYMMQSFPQVIENPFIQGLKARYVELNREYVALAKKYGPRHQRMVVVQDEIEDLEKRLSSEVGKIVNSIEIKLKQARAREASLTDELERVKEEVMGLSKKTLQLSMLQQEVESNREIYEMLLKREKETSLTSGLNTSNLFILDPATIPREPLKSQRRKALLMAVFAGLGLGLGLTLFLDYFDTAFHGPDEVKKHLGVPFLGPIGLVSGKNGKEGGSELEILREPRSHFAECMRNVGTNIVFSLPEGSQKAIVITSSNPFEGKTLIAANLAVVMAEMGRKVLLIDADMRVPRVHRLFDLPLEPGLSNLVFKTCPVRDPIQDTHVKSLKVLPAGSIPPNPVAVLSSSGMNLLTDAFKRHFDLVLFDTPPILSATDASLLGAAVDGVILVLQAATTKRDTAKRALEQLTQVKASALGVILNQVDFKRERYYYSYYSNYNYYYTPEGRKKYRRKSVQT
jgi:capsular exopolysaccharide synthesis family protein